MSGLRLVIVGDVLLDRDIDGTVERLTPDAPAPVLDVSAIHNSAGGAGLAALLAAGDGVSVALAAPIAQDGAGAALTRQLRHRVDVLAFGHAGPTRRKTRLRAGSHTLARVDDGGPGTPTRVPVAALRTLLADADAVLVSDYGGGVTLDRDVRAALGRAAARVPVVWDPHPRGGRPVLGAGLVTPNIAEARKALDDDGPPDRLAARLRDLWAARAVAVTVGSRGAFVVDGSLARYVPAPVASGDTCGAGDRFAVTAALAFAHGALTSEAVERGVADASAWVAAGGADGFHHREEVDTRPLHSPPQGGGLEDLAASLRSGGRRLVATGGCFDVLHAGHIATLQAARQLGDALVVLLNSDDSVRSLKGPGRPAVPADDRARVLRALGCVDAVVEFEGQDPRAALERLRPDVWVKGGDYGGIPLPEQEVIEAYGGRVMLLPYLDGRSSTQILQRTEQNRESIPEVVS